MAKFTLLNLPHCRNGGDMIPETCLTREDCVRACVASILELPARDVPNFFENANTMDLDVLTQQMQEWLAGRGYIAGMLGFSGAWTLDEFLAYMRRVYPDKHYMLYCDSGGDHAVIGCGGEIVHNPAWYKVAIDGPHSAGYWIVWFIARIV